MPLLTTLISVLKERMAEHDPERGGFEIASSMAIAAFGIVAALGIFTLIRTMGEEIVAYMQGLITGGF